MALTRCAGKADRAATIAVSIVSAFPVSYTHLDVYKRQRWNSVAKLCPTFSSVLVKPGRSELVESESSASTPFFPYSPMAVSYTHLAALHQRLELCARQLLTLNQGTGHRVQLLHML